MVIIENKSRDEIYADDINFVKHFEGLPKYNEIHETLCPRKVMPLRYVFYIIFLPSCNPLDVM